MWSTSHCIWMGVKKVSVFARGFGMCFTAQKAKVRKDISEADPHSTVFFWALSAIKIVSIFMLASLFQLGVSLPAVHVNLLLIPLTFFSCCLGSCQFRSVSLSFQVLQGTSRAISSFSAR